MLRRQPLRSFAFLLLSDPMNDEAQRTQGVSFNKRESHLRSILATVPDAMVVIDEMGRILSFSAAAEKMFGYAESEVIGENVAMLMPSPDRERHDGYLSHYRDTGERKIIGIGRVTTARHRHTPPVEDPCEAFMPQLASWSQEAYQKFLNAEGFIDLADQLGCS